MITINGVEVEQNKFPDGTLLLKGSEFDVHESYSDESYATIEWLFESNEELVTLIFAVKHLRSVYCVEHIALWLPYIPNARMDRVKSDKEVFTLKYFAEIINSLNFSSVTVLDPHSYVSEALIDRLNVWKADIYATCIIDNICPDLLFFTDEGGMKRYANLFEMPYVFGMKQRDWETGNILGLDVLGQTDKIKGSKILIIDDICSKGGTFYHSATKLKELGAGEIYLYVSHCENTILEGEVLTSGLIEKVFTTNSIFTKEHEKIEVIKLW